MGCGGADKLWKAWPVLRGFWHPWGLLASWSWDLDLQDGHLGFQMSWRRIYGGISQLALEPRMTFIPQSGMTELECRVSFLWAPTYLARRALLEVVLPSVWNREKNKQSEQLWVNNAFGSSWQPRDALHLPMLFADGSDNVITQHPSHRPTMDCRILKKWKVPLSIFLWMNFFILCVRYAPMSTTQSSHSRCNFVQMFFLFFLTESLLWW